MGISLVSVSTVCVCTILEKRCRRRCRCVRFARNCPFSPCERKYGEIFSLHLFLRHDYRRPRGMTRGLLWRASWPERRSWCHAHRLHFDDAMFGDDASVDDGDCYPPGDNACDGADNCRNPEMEIALFFLYPA